ncbi:MAG: hypothetical protein NWF00_12130 [Candidatus Bathyarchaeota archaeon]|nr:hypothetical protein [Candidatus Bathyarchaeota archaeon]
MKHNISITLEQKLFREIESSRGREKRSTFIEYLIVQGLKNYKTNPQLKTMPALLAFATSTPLEKRKRE